MPQQPRLVEPLRAAAGGAAAVPVAGVGDARPSGVWRFRAYQHVADEGDWRRPRSVPATWTSMVQLDLLARLNPSVDVRAKDFEYDAVEDEVRTERSHDAPLLSLADKLPQRQRGLDMKNS